MENNFNKEEFLKKFNELDSLPLDDIVTKKVTGKKTLKYLTWTDAVKHFTKVFPDFDYEVCFFDGKPYVYDPMTGYMVFVKVTAGGKTKTMWLPVMDEHNAAMKDEPYQIEYKNGTKVTVKAATMFEINRSIMRAYVKALSMFGLGLSLYKAEDTDGNAQPSNTAAKPNQQNNANANTPKTSNGKASDKQIQFITGLMKNKGIETSEAQVKFLKEKVGVERYADLTTDMASKLIESLK